MKSSNVGIKNPTSSWTSSRTRSAVRPLESSASFFSHETFGRLLSSSRTFTPLHYLHPLTSRRTYKDIYVCTRRHQLAVPPMMNSDRGGTMKVLPNVRGSRTLPYEYLRRSMAERGRRSFPGKFTREILRCARGARSLRSRFLVSP